MRILHYDYTSLAAAIAVLRVQAVLRVVGRADDAVVWRGIEAVPLAAPVPLTGDQRVELGTLAEAARARDLRLAPPSRRPPTLDAHLVTGLAERRRQGARWRRRVIEAYWSQDADLSDHSVLVALAAEVGIDATAVREALADAARRAAVRGRMAAERRRGIGGVPVLEVDGAFVGLDMSDDDLGALLAL